MTLPLEIKTQSILRRPIVRKKILEEDTTAKSDVLEQDFVDIRRWQENAGTTFHRGAVTVHKNGGPKKFPKAHSGSPA